VLILYQTEWCPFSAAVRELLTERGIDFVARQVEPWPEQRAALAARAGTDRIPVIEDEAGRFYRGTREIFAYLTSSRAWEHDLQHRQRFRDHAPAREADVVGDLIELVELPSRAAAADGRIRVEHDPDNLRYILYLDDRAIGLLAYRARPDAVVFTHTEIEPASERRGYGSRLVHDALEDARARGVHVVPLCPFAAAYIERHPEFRGLVAPGYGQRAGV
jgi:predicted GNAT family acetyltransferase/glutaredoxin